MKNKATQGQATSGTSSPNDFSSESTAILPIAQILEQAKIEQQQPATNQPSHSLGTSPPAAAPIAQRTQPPAAAAAERDRVATQKLEAVNKTVTREVVVIFSAKGGAGATTVAVNLAHKLASNSKETVCLLDLNFQLGDDLAALAVQPKLTIAQAIRSLDQGSGFAINSLARHASGLYVLSQVGNIDDTDALQPEAVARVLAYLRNQCHHVIIDGVNDFNDHALAALDIADKIILICVQEVLAVRRCRWIVGILRKIGFESGDIVVLFNRFQARSEIGYATLQRLFDPSPVVALPDEADIALRALNRGIPLASLNANNSLVRNIARLAEKNNYTASEEVVGATALGKAPPWWKRWFVS